MSVIDDTGIERLTERVRAAQAPLLMLDYDGTLAPFQVERMAAVPVAGALDALRELLAAGHTRIALVSGRPIAELLQLIGELPLQLVGAHGREERAADGTRTDHPPTPRQAAGLDRAEQAIASSVPSERWERKLASVAVHVRGLSDTTAGALLEGVRERWEPIARESELEVRGFDGGVELRARGRTKGDAVLHLLGQWPDTDLAVYIGDDDTDEDAFGVLREHPGGLGLRVGGNERASAADGRLDDPWAVARLIKEWHDVRSNS